MKQKIQDAIAQTTSMVAAAKLLNMPMTSFKRMAKKYNLYNPSKNYHGWAKGLTAEKDSRVKNNPHAYDIQDVLNGKYPNYARGHLKRRLLKYGIKQNKCEICKFEGLWNGKPINMILDHINGINNDHRLENLRMVCPMCNTQLDTFCSKNIAFKKGSVSQLVEEADLESVQ